MPQLSDVLSLFDTIVLGIVQGLTEFFPVSSDGHLAVAQHFLSYSKQSLAFDVLLHAGTLGSLYLCFKKETHELIHQAWHLPCKIRQVGLRPTLKSDRWIWYILGTTFVTGALGICLEDTIESLSSDIRVAGIGFLITSGALFLTLGKRKGVKTPEDLGLWFPLVLGLSQAAALFTGVSRSGMTIATALILGVQPEKAARFSFVVSIPIIFLAILFETRKLSAVDSGQLMVMSVGVIVSFVVGLVAIKGLMAMIRKLSLLPFAIYTLLLGLWCLIYG